VGGRGRKLNNNKKEWTSSNILFPVRPDLKDNFSLSAMARGIINKVLKVL